MSSTNSCTALLPSESTSQKFKISRRVSTPGQCVAVELADIRVSCSSTLRPCRCSKLIRKPTPNLVNRHHMQKITP